jgi:hypothetical protein
MVKTIGKLILRSGRNLHPKGKDKDAMYRMWQRKEEIKIDNKFLPGNLM